MEKILFIAPLPPPTNGQSKASAAVLNALEEKFEVTVVNLSKTSLKNGANSIGRVRDIVRILRKIKRNDSKHDLIFISLAESFAGNMRDMAIYYIFRKNLKNVYIQMLGGAGMQNILSEKNWQQRMNAKVLQNIGGVIVEGSLNYNLFKQFVPQQKIHIIPNFAEDFLFLSSSEIEEKFINLDMIQILFLSNMLPGKGYIELADAYIALSAELQEKMEIKFVGGFESWSDKTAFLEKIKQYPKLSYLGKFIDGLEKKELFRNSHVFCLPTYYEFEGQPISILEAYATGCAVITTDHSGIPFIFEDHENGYLVEAKSVSSLEEVLKNLFSDKNRLAKTALHNNQYAYKNYRISTYKRRIANVFENR